MRLWSRVTALQMYTTCSGLVTSVGFELLGVLGRTWQSGEVGPSDRETQCEQTLGVSGS